MAIQHCQALGFTFAALAAMLMARPAQALPGPAGDVRVADFLPDSFVADGSVSYMPQLQQALDRAGAAGGVVTFPPGTFLLDEPAGLRVPPGTTLVMRGTRFVLASGLEEDGQAFLGEDVDDVCFIGGTIQGARDSWAPGANIAGIRIRGASAGIQVSGMRFQDLSSNGIGLFGTGEARIQNVRIENVTVRNCCNFYGDYLSDNPGPAEGSDREDQGGIAFYHVEHWVVDGCELRGSQSDGTHFYHSHHGRFVNSSVLASNMGGYFLEGCHHVIAANNLISGNGSRGVTIERDSAFCTLQGNIVEHSGREGLWAPDVMGILVTGNIFRENGRKDDTDRDCEIRIDNGDRYETQTRDICVTDNLFYTSAHQTASVMVTGGVRDCVIRGNSFRGAVDQSHIFVAEPAGDSCMADANDIK